MKHRLVILGGLAALLSASALCSLETSGGAQPPITTPGQGGAPPPFRQPPGQPGNGGLPGRPDLPGDRLPPDSLRRGGRYGHPNLTEGIRLLTQARDAIIRAERERYENNGHRANAARLTDRAIRELQAAIQQSDREARRR